MVVEPETASGGSFAYEGKTYWFCSPGCNEEFQHKPAEYLAGVPPHIWASVSEPARARAPVPAGVRLVCLMHLEITSYDPLATCSICGMALEPEVPTLD